MVLMILLKFSVLFVLVKSCNAVDCTQKYTVVGGDSCYTISQKFGLDNDAFMQSNNISPDCNNLQVGQSVCVGNGNNSSNNNPPQQPPSSTGTHGQQMTITNNCSWNVWPGFQAAAGHSIPFNGGTEMLSANGGSVTFDVPYGWTAGRIWVRVGCENGMDTCSSGGCGNRIQCAGAGGALPLSLAEFTYDINGRQVSYDVSYVDGFNAPLSIKPLSNDGTGNCQSVPSCDLRNPSLNLPDGIVVRNAEGNIYLTRSLCEWTNSDYVCCRGASNTKDTCNPGLWSPDVQATYNAQHGQCPKSYIFAYDDNVALFQCPIDTSFQITIC